jgi:hypothetical protein
MSRHAYSHVQSASVRRGDHAGSERDLFRFARRALSSTGLVFLPSIWIFDSAAVFQHAGPVSRQDMYAELRSRAYQADVFEHFPEFCDAAAWGDVVLVLRARTDGADSTALRVFLSVDDIAIKPPAQPKTDRTNRERSNMPAVLPRGWFTSLDLGPNDAR